MRNEAKPKPQTLAQIYSAAIKAERLKQGLTQAKLGALVGVSQQQIAKLEGKNPNPSIFTMAGVAAALGLELHIQIVPRKK